MDGTGRRPRTPAGLIWSATASASMNVCMHARVPTSREKCIPLLKFLIPFPQVAQERHRPPKRPGGDRIANTCHIRAIIIIISLLQLLGAPGRPGKTPAPETAPPRVAGTSTVDTERHGRGDGAAPRCLGICREWSDCRCRGHCGTVPAMSRSACGPATPRIDTECRAHEVTISLRSVAGTPRVTAGSLRPCPIPRRRNSWLFADPEETMRSGNRARPN